MIESDPAAYLGKDFDGKPIQPGFYISPQGIIQIIQKGSRYAEVSGDRGEFVRPLLPPVPEHPPVPADPSKPEKSKKPLYDYTSYRPLSESDLVEKITALESRANWLRQGCERLETLGLGDDEIGKGIRPLMDHAYPPASGFSRDNVPSIVRD